MNTSQIYEVILRPGVDQILPKHVPVVFSDALADALATLADDPWNNSRVPVCPPHFPHGRLHSFSVDLDTARHYVNVFFEIDDGRRQCQITHIAVQPRPPALAAMQSLEST
jgi:hypothetical protein